MEIVTTSSRGQIVIPERIRKRHKIKEGTKLILFEENDKIILEKESNIESLIQKRKGSETLNLMLASQKSLAKDWGSKEDDVWDKYY